MKVLSIIGIAAGIIGIIISILIFFTLGQIPGILKSTSFEQLDKIKIVLDNTEKTISNISNSADEAKVMLNSLSSSVKNTETIMRQMGKGMDEIADLLEDFGNFSELKKASSMMKNYDVTNFTNSVSRLSSKIDDLKMSTQSISGSIAGTKNSIVKVKENIEDITSIISRAMLLLSLFLFVFSIGLLAFSLNLYFLEKKMETPGE